MCHRNFNNMKQSIQTQIMSIIFDQKKKLKVAYRNFNTMKQSNTSGVLAYPKKVILVTKTVY
jgi:hypothetical protein